MTYDGASACASSFKGAPHPHRNTNSHRCAPRAGHEVFQKRKRTKRRKKRRKSKAKQKGLGDPTHLGTTRVVSAVPNSSSTREAIADAKSTIHCRAHSSSSDSSRSLGCRKVGGEGGGGSSRKTAATGEQQLVPTPTWSKRKHPHHYQNQRRQPRQLQQRRR